MIEQLPLSHVFARKDARKTDDAALRLLSDSIREIGIINPLRVRPARRMVDGVEADAYEVTAGNHRLKAARKLGLETVPCIIVNDDDLHAELAMIDENLVRAELGTGDRDKAIKRRKEIYLELHPETARGNSQAIGMNNSLGHNVSEIISPTFTEATATAIGKTKRTVEMSVERGEKIYQEVVDLLRGTPLDKGSYYNSLKDLSQDRQIEKARRDLARDKEERRLSRTPRHAVKEWEDVEEDQRRSLMNAWNKASPSVRAWFREEIVDAPIMDQGAAA